LIRSRLLPPLPPPALLLLLLGAAAGLVHVDAVVVELATAPGVLCVLTDDADDCGVCGGWALSALVGDGAVGVLAGGAGVCGSSEELFDARLPILCLLCPTASSFDVLSAVGVIACDDELPPYEARRPSSRPLSLDLEAIRMQYWQADLSTSGGWAHETTETTRSQSVASVDGRYRRPRIALSRCQARANDLRVDCRVQSGPVRDRL
jgi:hypothetical protein